MEDVVIVAHAVNVFLAERLGESAIHILNRSSFAEGLLTEAERAWSGDLRPSQSKLGHNENCWGE
jgi:hypothetical protein